MADCSLGDTGKGTFSRVVDAKAVKTKSFAGSSRERAGDSMCLACLLECSYDSYDSYDGYDNEYYGWNENRK